MGQDDIQRKERQVTETRKEGKIYSEIEKGDRRKAGREMKQSSTKGKQSQLVLLGLWKTLHSKGGNSYW